MTRRGAQNSEGLTLFASFTVRSVKFPIPSVDAQALGLPGSDVYRNEHIGYLPGLNRAAMTWRLLENAVVVFRDTAELQLRAELKDEWQLNREWGAAGADPTMWPHTPVQNWIMRNRLYEQFKIGVGLELIAKAHLLMAGFVVHEIARGGPANGSSDLARSQENSPVAVDELAACDGWLFDGVHNFLAGLKPQSLSFTTILKVEYLDALPLSEGFKRVAEIYRPLRNEFHFPVGLAIPDYGKLSPTPPGVSVDLSAEVIAVVNAHAIDFEIGRASCRERVLQVV